MNRGEEVRRCRVEDCRAYSRHLDSGLACPFHGRQYHPTYEVTNNPTETEATHLPTFGGGVVRGGMS